MTFLPIVERELRVAARRRSTPWVRFWFAAGMIGAWALFMITAGRHTRSHELAEATFGILTTGAMGFALFAGLFLTADCLSVEKREGTLGLLFLTDLKGYDIVLGKLAASSLNAVYGLLAIFPVLGLPILLGGVTGGEFARVVLVLTVTLGFSIATGMMASALHRDARAALGTTLVILLVASAVLPALAWFDAVLFNSGSRHTWQIMVASPPATLFLAFDDFYRGSGVGWFWASVLTLTGLSDVFLAVASVMLPRSWQTQTESAPRRRKGGNEEALAAGFRHRSPWLERNPFQWLAMEQSRPGRLAGLALVLVAGLWLSMFLGSIFSRRDKEEFFIFSVLAAYAAHLVLKVRVALEATRRLHEDRGSGALELLLATPLPPAIILEGLVATLRRRFRAGLILVSLINAAMLLLILGSNSLHLDEDDWFFHVALIGGGGLLWADFQMITWVGMLHGLTRPRHLRAVLTVMWRVFLPTVIGVLLFIAIAMTGRGVSEDSLGVMVVCWSIGSLFFSLVAGSSARTQLTDHFRELAAGLPPKPWYDAPISGAEPAAASTEGPPGENSPKPLAP